MNSKKNKLLNSKKIGYVAHIIFLLASLLSLNLDLLLGPRWDPSFSYLLLIPTPTVSLPTPNHQQTHTPAPWAGSLLEMGWPPEPQPPGPPGHHSLVHWLPTDLRMHLLHGQMFIYDVARLLLPKDPAIETPKYSQRGQISVWI